MSIDKPRIEAAVRELLIGIGEDPDREGLQGTPDRVARACEEIFGGLSDDPGSYLRKQFHEDGNEEMVVVRDIPFSSMCEHHLLPFYGVAHVAYLPSAQGRVCGISKLARTVELFARRLQLQERLTSQVADAVMDNLAPQGVIVKMSAEHMCMTMRGVSKPGSHTVTLATRGVFADDAALAARALSLLD